MDLCVNAYRRYCWDVRGIDDYRITPFHILATEVRAWNSESQIWHMESIAKYTTDADPVFVATDHMLIDLSDESGVTAGSARRDVCHHPHMRPSRSI